MKAVFWVWCCVIKCCWGIKGGVWSDTNVFLLSSSHVESSCKICHCNFSLPGAVGQMSLFFVCLLLQKSITMSLVQNSLGKLLLLSCCVGCRILKQGAPCDVLAFQMSPAVFAHLMVLQKHTEMAPVTIRVGVYSVSSSLEGVYFSVSLNFHLVELVEVGQQSGQLISLWWWGWISKSI